MAHFFILKLFFLESPMAILFAVINSLGSYHPHLFEISDADDFKLAAAQIMSKVRTIAAFAYRKSINYPFIYPDPELSYCMNFLHMMFSIPYKRYVPSEEAVQALSLFFMVHADHEQNCSCSTVRMVGSSGASLFASVAAGICALWGPLHYDFFAHHFMRLEIAGNTGNNLPDFISDLYFKYQ